MPEPYWPKRKGSFTLSQAHAGGLIIRAYCAYHKRERFYLPDDLRRAFGDIECDDLTYFLKCDCDLRLRIGTEVLTAERRQTIIVRRLVSVTYERRLKWRDEPADL